ncbi:uncharacterized protein LOC131164172 [Malania oleifera]|uniref:uncharacterized protein LOC131164172 n=1 Tax=Malania oleifera TaxID=397392 RepID=UPI0025AE0AAC|nr:uncharacterized protein LOC131164172 [Malania oleifera]
MPKNEAGARSWRKPLRDVSNGGKSSKPLKKKVSETEGRTEDDVLDRLLLVQSDISTLLHQIDELVVQTFKLKPTSRQGRKEIESFTDVLSEMLCSLKPWVPRFQKALSSPSMRAKDQLEQILASKPPPAVNENARNVADSPQQTELDSLISPSPLVSWRADCTIERGRQLFLLTPLPMSKALSSRKQRSKSIFERIASNADAELPSFCIVSEDVDDGFLEGVAVKSTPNKLHESSAAEVVNNSECGFTSPPRSSKKDCSFLVMTPCLKISPPKSCVLLEPISESSLPDNDNVHKSEMSDSSGSQVSKSLALKYPELFGIQPTHKLGIRKKEVEASPDWFMSPLKTCVLMEPPDEKPLKNAAACFPRTTPALKNQIDFSSVLGNDVQSSRHLRNKNFSQELGDTSYLIGSTPMGEPESSIQIGKHPGETTLKKELWKKFEAASTNGLHFSISVQQTAQGGFLDRLDEVSCDETSSEGLR